MNSKSLTTAAFLVLVAACSADAGNSGPSGQPSPSGAAGEEGTGGTSGGGAGGGSESTEPPIDGASCTERCEAKATSCGAPASMLDSICGYYCGEAMTESEMSCLESESCSALQSKSTSCLGASGSTGGTGSSTGGGGSTGSGGSSSGGGTSGGGSTTTCSSAKTCSADAKAVTSCTVVSGVPVQTTTTCSNGTCKNGACGYCSKASDCSTIGSCKCQDKQSVYTTVEATCRSGKCSQESPNCATLCKDHGGPA